MRSNITAFRALNVLIKSRLLKHTFASGHEDYLQCYVLLIHCSTFA